ncbi:nuclear transport factor 2 family protein [Pseudonocardia nigra]|uniref:nuclear transport factor 2 family protein n=1 Tax=Pseudonocardia nigra TaxID=1921578 RepID=UPI001C5DB814|nr:nuclear transport factor 2 family protein [Pseudonocardia nigra]
MSRNLTDRCEIDQLVQRLAACLDDGRYEDLRGIFTADATARTPGGLAEGIDALVTQAARIHSTKSATQHLLGAALIDLGADTAAVRANALVTMVDRGPDRRPALQMGEVYRLGARRTPEGWRLTSVETVPLWAEGNVPALAG